MAQPAPTGAPRASPAGVTDICNFADFPLSPKCLVAAFKIIRQATRIRAVPRWRLPMRSRVVRLGLPVGAPGCYGIHRWRWHPFDDDR